MSGAASSTKTRRTFLTGRIAELEQELGLEASNQTSTGASDDNAPPESRHKIITESENAFRFSKQKSDAKLQETKIEITSLSLSNLLRETIPNHPFHDSSKFLCFDYPYSPLIHNWDLLAKKQVELDENKPSECSKDSPYSTLSRLRNAISTPPEHDLFAKYFRERDYHMKQNTTTWETLWTLFPPGTSVYGTPFQGEDQMFIVCSLPELSFPEAGQKVWSLYCWIFDWDGKSFQKHAIVLEFDKFDGIKTINSLPYYPLDFYRDGEMKQLSEVKRKLLERGKKHEEVCTRPRKASLYRYEGDVSYTDMFQEEFVSKKHGNHKPSSKHIDDVLIVDYASWYECVGPDFALGDLRHYKGATACTCPECLGNYHLNEALKLGWDQIRINAESGENQGPESNIGLTDLQYMSLPPRVLAFAIQTKVWVQASVAQLELKRELREADWMQKFESLQLDQDTKDVLRYVVQYHTASTDSSEDFEDFIPGKGTGIVILLHGPPGVGKTLTAETVALVSNRPLLTVGSSEIGTTAAKVEKNLQSMFKVAAQLKAVILFDEADTFMESRTHDSDMERNAIVTVFLRILDYYPGIVILTTNRITSFDVAVQSRVNITILYRELDFKQRKNIYNSFLNQLERKGLVEDIDEMQEWVDEDWAQDPLNGRDIRNILSSAVALAKSAGRKIRPNDVAKVQSITRQFMLQMEAITIASKAINQAREIDY